MLQDRKYVQLWGRTWAIMMLPTFSLSGINASGFRRMVFDWGKSMSHPHAQIAFAIMSGHSVHIDRLIFKNKMYAVADIRNCRSGRKAAMVREIGMVSHSDCAIIDALLAQEFPSKPTV